MIKAVVWNEYSDIQKQDEVKSIYPNGLHSTIADFLQAAGINAQCALLDMPEQGLTDALLEDTDVLLWWGHSRHDEVSEQTVQRVLNHVYRGMGVIFLHSAHFARPFIRLMGTTCSLKWREAAERQRLWTINPSHPIAQGIDECVEIEQEEMYGEYFDIPEPDQTVFLGWFKGGEVFRSGITYKRGNGNVFYFQPGHETYPVYHNKQIQKIIINAVNWAAPKNRYAVPQAANAPAKEKLD